MKRLMWLAGVLPILLVMLAIVVLLALEQAVELAAIMLAHFGWRRAGRDNCLALR
jgi:hypothetical protein